MYTEVTLPPNARHFESWGPAVLAYGISANLANLREAFEKKIASGAAQYFKTGDLELATETVQAVDGGHVYRLRMQLRDRQEPKLYLSPSLKLPGQDWMMPRFIRRFADGIALTSENGDAIEMPFAADTLEVIIEGALLQEDTYTVKLYKSIG